jgi:hypothetical protein
MSREISTVCLVDFCTCPADFYTFFPFLCQSYVAVLKQLSFNLKIMYFFLQSLNFERLLPVFVSLARISAGCLRFSTTGGLQKSTRRRVYRGEGDGSTCATSTNCGSYYKYKESPVELTGNSVVDG